jgi:hypothetical protein
LLATACSSNNAHACNTLGWVYSNGRFGQPQDQAKGVVLFTKGCDGGSALACFNLGQAYEKGQGVTADPARAAALFHRFCDPDSFLADACNELGSMYRFGSGINQDLVLASKYLKKACDAELQAHPPEDGTLNPRVHYACLNLAGVEQAAADQERARRHAALGDLGQAPDVVHDLSVYADNIAKVTVTMPLYTADKTVLPGPLKNNQLKLMTQELVRFRAMFCKQKKADTRQYTPKQWDGAVKVRCEDSPVQSFYYPNVFPNPNPPLDMVEPCKQAYATVCP